MIYLDNNATTAIDPEICAFLTSIYKEGPANPSSIHHFGQQAKARLVEATRTIATYFNVSTDEVIFTSGATEALNLVIRSIPQSAHVITSSLEHIAVLEALKCTGCSVSYLDPKPGRGAIDVDQVEAALRPETAAIVLMAANNETGVVTDLEAIAALAQKCDLPLIVDGVSAVGKFSAPLPAGVTAFCFSGHKIHAPQGVGCAVVRHCFQLDPLIVGGGQQHGLRGGTENLPAICALARAIELLQIDTIGQMRELRDHFEQSLSQAIDGLFIHGGDQHRLCNTSQIAFPDIGGETFLMQLDMAGVAASHGSACSSGTLEPSRVLLSMGVSRTHARSSLRFSLSRFTTRTEIDQAVEIINSLQRLLR